MNRVLSLTGCTAFLCFSLAFSSPAHATTSIRIPHWMDYHCTNISPTYYGTGCDVNWSPVEGAASYYVKSSLSWSSDRSYPHPTHVSGVMGGSRGGQCGDQNAEDFRAQCLSWGPFFELFAMFPDNSGNLKIDKKRTGPQQGTVVPGQQVNFKIQYKNVGPGSIDEAIITDSLPPYVTWVAGGNPQPDGSVQWVVRRIARGETGFVTLVVKVAEDIPPTITNIYNLVVATPPTDQPAPPPKKDPKGKSPTTGAAVSYCDSLVNQGSSGDAAWLDTPDMTAFQPLELLDKIQGHDQVTVNAGYAAFKHTVATGQLLLSGGGFTLTTCEDLTRTPDVLSVLTLAANTSFQHSISGIMDPAETVNVRGTFLTIRIHEGTYTYQGDASGETVSVDRGTIVVVDPRKKTHRLGAGQTFSWPTQTAAAGPQFTSTAPADRTAVSWDSFSVTYAFDQPVVSLGTGSRFGVSKNHSATQGFSGTLADLVSGGQISLGWNAPQDALTITVSSSAGIDAVEEAVFLALHLEDVTGATAATPVLDKALNLFLVRGATGAREVYFDRFYFKSDVPAPNTMAVEMLDALPGPPPKGLYQASPAYHFTISHDYAGALNTLVYLAGATRTFLPETTTGIGIYRWNGSAWIETCEGCGGVFDGRGYPLKWFGMADGTGAKEFTTVLFSRMLDPRPPRIISVKPAAAKVLPSTPLVIKVNAPLGVDQGLTQVFINGVQQFSYDPGSDSAPDWTVAESAGVTTMTLATHPDWPKGKVVKGSVLVYGRFGVLSASKTFSFKVP